LSAPNSAGAHQPLKIRRNRKQAKRMTPTIEESEGGKSFEHQPSDGKGMMKVAARANS